MISLSLCFLFCFFFFLCSLYFICLLFLVFGFLTFLSIFVNSFCFSLYFFFLFLFIFIFFRCFTIWFYKFFFHYYVIFLYYSFLQDSTPLPQSTDLVILNKGRNFTELKQNIIIKALEKYQLDQIMSKQRKKNFLKLIKKIRS